MPDAGFDYIATKKVMAAALSGIAGGTAAIYAASAPPITEAITRLVDRATSAGDIRSGVEPLDLLYALVGLSYANASPGWQARALR